MLFLSQIAWKKYIYNKIVVWSSQNFSSVFSFNCYILPWTQSNGSSYDILESVIYY